MKRFLVAVSLSLIGCCLLLIGARTVGRALEYPFKLSGRQPIPIAPPYDQSHLLPSYFPGADQSVNLDLRSSDGERLILGNVNYFQAGHWVAEVGIVLHTSAQNAADTLNYNAGLMGHSIYSYFPKDSTPYVFFYMDDARESRRLCVLQYVNNERWIISIQSASCSALLEFLQTYPY